MSVVLLVEGQVESQLVRGFVRRCLARRIRDRSLPRLDFIAMGGAPNLVRSLPRDADNQYRSQRRPLVFGCLIDIHECPHSDPDLPLTERVRETEARLRQLIRERNQEAAHWTRFYFSVHESEAWLLSHPELFSEPSIQSRVRALAARPETVNGKKPPSQHLNEFFLRSSRACGYHKVIHGTPLWRSLDPAVAESRCPHLKAMIDDLEARICSSA